MNKFLFVLLAGLALNLQNVSAQSTGPIKLSLTPNPPPTPALRFALLPELIEQVPGNAAPLYRKTADLLKQVANGPEQAGLQNLLAKWETMPLDQLPREEMRKALALFREPLEQLEKATRSEYCDWEFSQRLREQGIGAPLAEIQKMRYACQVLCVKARLELADGRPDLALRTLRSNTTLSKHAGESPTLIAHLVGTALGMKGFLILPEVLAHPKTPNLYWSLSSLPQPFLDIRKPFEGERLMAYGTFPGALELANNLDAGPLTPGQIEKIVKVSFSIDGNGGGNIAERFVLTQLIRNKHEIAKKALVAAGRSAEKVEQWPHVQVALMHALAEYDQMLDEMLKWRSFPFWQAEPALAKLNTRMRPGQFLDRGGDKPAIPLAPLLLPAISKVMVARSRLDRQLASLRRVEALRLYAAEHKGQFPATLEEIKDTPIPLCPLTGKPFEYQRLGDDKAVLTAPPAPTLGASIKPLSYELTLRR